MGEFIERRKDGGCREPSGAAAVDDKFGSKFPALLDHLVSTLWPDGSGRETSTILVFCEGGGWKACLHDRDAGMQCFVSGESFEALIKAADAACRPGKGDWRVKQPKKR